MTLRNNKYNSIAKTKGYKWKEAEIVKNVGKEDTVDLSYYDKLADDAQKSIEEYLNSSIYFTFDEFVDTTHVFESDTIKKLASKM